MAKRRSVVFYGKVDNYLVQLFMCPLLLVVGALIVAHLIDNLDLEWRPAIYAFIFYWVTLGYVGKHLRPFMLFAGMQEGDDKTDITVVYKKKKTAGTLDNLYMESRNERSLRTAIVEDDGKSAWLYLTEPETHRIIADVWVYNRVPPPSKDELKLHGESPPPATIGFASANETYQLPKKFCWTFQWSENGDSIALLRDELPVACIVNARKRGYSRGLLKDGPWGNIWRNELYFSAFNIVE